MPPRVQKINRVIRTSLLGVIVFGATTSACLELFNRSSSLRMANVGKETSVSILSFNILSTIDVSALSEGYPIWDQRKQAVWKTIRQKSPDLLAILECTPSQLDEFTVHFGEEYTVIENRGFSPDSIVLVSKKRFRILEQGHWALEEPLAAKIRRLAIWTKMEDRFTKRQLMMIGTHLDAKTLKENEIKLLREKIEPDQVNQAPIFLAGDFNFAPDSKYYPLMVGGQWFDSFRVKKGAPVPLQASYPAKDPKRRIDHIFYFGKDVEVKNWQIIDFRDQGLLSDHLPVYAEFLIREAN